MKWILDLTTRAKLFAGFGLMILFLAAAIAAAYEGITAVRDSQKRLGKDFALAVDLKHV